MERYLLMRTLLFISGTRADFGKLKPLMRVVQDDPEFSCRVFATGMHLLGQYGLTYREIEKSGFADVFKFHNQHLGEPMETVLANTIEGLSRYVHEDKPDLVVVHGDRVEALAGAIVGALNNIRVAHIEGGERSGTVDELIRHSVSKLAHLHFVANGDARDRLMQMGERRSSIIEIGSPDIDVMLGEDLPELQDVKDRYGIEFEDYGLCLYHPVTTEIERQQADVDALINALERSRQNYVVIYPNNDPGSDLIINKYRTALAGSRYRVFPSVRFEYFLTLLKNAGFVVGNSSAGIREAPVFGIPTINIGTRQNRRWDSHEIINVDMNSEAILGAIAAARSARKQRIETPSAYHFGSGGSAELFRSHLKDPHIWSVPIQKTFQDVTGGLPFTCSPGSDA